MTPFLLNGLAAGSVYALLAFGFGLVYFATGVFHFAHGAVFAIAGYAFWWTFAVAGWSLPAAALAAVAAAALLGWFVEVALYRPLRDRRAPVDVLFLTSLGAYTVTANALAAGFGHQLQMVPLELPSLVLREAAPGELPLLLTGAQVAALGLAAGLFVVLCLLLTRTPFGLALRAYTANPALAESFGVEPRRLLPQVALLGSALAAVAAMAVAADTGVSPDMGLRAVVVGAVAVVIGGVGSLPGTALAALLLGVLQHLARYRLPERWEEALTFSLLLAVLLLRPRGLFGRRDTLR